MLLGAQSGSFVSATEADITYLWLPGHASTSANDSKRRYAARVGTFVPLCSTSWNFVSLCFTDEVVEVIPITDQYTAALHDVPIAGGALHLSLDKGLGYILVVNQG